MAGLLLTESPDDASGKCESTTAVPFVQAGKHLKVFDDKDASGGLLYGDVEDVAIDAAEENDDVVLVRLTNDKQKRHTVMLDGKSLEAVKPAKRSLIETHTHLSVCSTDVNAGAGAINIEPSGMIHSTPVFIEAGLTDYNNQDGYALARISTLTAYQSEICT